MKPILIVVLFVMFHIQYVAGQSHIIEGDYVRYTDSVSTSGWD